MDDPSNLGQCLGFSTGPPALEHKDSLTTIFNVSTGITVVCECCKQFCKLNKSLKLGFEIEIYQTFITKYSI